MKRLVHIVFALVGALVVVGSCNRLPRPAATPSQRGIYWTLEGIDSLMWKEPDSALTVMLEFAGSAEADSMDAFEGHYCQLLISELLYKNYYGQSNREALLKAVGYFDSIVAADEADTRKADARGASLRERNVFLDARAHYINGVGFYEEGEVVNACVEYLMTLEVMESYYDDKAITGKKAVFMAYTYNRLMELFSEQFMSVPAITCGENALVFCNAESSLSNKIPIIVFHIGMQYDKKGEKNKARQYYASAINEMSDTSSLIYRDMVSLKALCDYQLGTGIGQTMSVLKKTVSQANNEQERLTRFVTIGDVFFEEGLYDSALVYLEPVFINSENKLSKVQSAEYLRIIYDGLGNKEKLDECVRYLASHKKSVGETNTLVSELEDKFKDYMNQKQKKEAETERKKSIERTVRIIVPIAVAVALVILVVAKLRGWKKLKQQRAEADKTLEETAKRHEEALKTKDSQHEQEMKAKQAEALQQKEAAQRSHEEELKRQQAETERLICGIKQGMFL